MFHSYVTVDQRITPFNPTIIPLNPIKYIIKSHETSHISRVNLHFPMVFPCFSYGFRHFPLQDLSNGPDLGLRKRPSKSSRQGSKASSKPPPEATVAPVAPASAKEAEARAWGREDGKKLGKMMGKWWENDGKHNKQHMDNWTYLPVSSCIIFYHEISELDQGKNMCKTNRGGPKGKCERWIFSIKMKHGRSFLKV